MRTVCKSTGVRPNSAKADIYTVIGLDSKHPSGIKSTVSVVDFLISTHSYRSLDQIWNPHDLIPDAELKVSKRSVSTTSELTPWSLARH